MVPQSVAVFLVVVGGITIALVYGPPAAGLGLVCLLAGAGVLGLLWLVLLAIERLAEEPTSSFQCPALGGPT